MRTKIIVVGSSVLLAFGAALAQDAPKPGPEQKALGYFDEAKTLIAKKTQ